ncbi:hypothetical protein PRIPAC_94582 [Pristionchus pacificus]|uniref:Uncharacterized protein n=1 Tax=Pristionchus pacificus TaxID=54126 RepID=A0A2A6C909_PRIPA|nr:hypothetical protein PRIPAC_94582 [Pristionchus pacificus]|eukprot:PDM74705.1 hypothetical protein PRIPAC_43656 [Pristionchus pacificus]
MCRLCDLLALSLTLFPSHSTSDSLPRAESAITTTAGASAKDAARPAIVSSMAKANCDLFFEVEISGSTLRLPLTRSPKGSFRPFPSLPSPTHSFCFSLLALAVPLDYLLLAKPSCAFIRARSPSVGRNAL